MGAQQRLRSISALVSLFIISDTFRARGFHLVGSVGIWRREPISNATHGVRAIRKTLTWHPTL